MTPFIAFILFLFGGAVASIATFLIVNNKKQKALDHMITAAEKEASEIIRKSEEIARTVRQEIEESKTELRERKQEITQSEEKLREKDARLEAKLEDLDKKQNTLREKSDALDGKIRTIDEKEATITTRLEEVAHLSQEDAKELLLETAEQRYEKDILAVIEKKRQEYRIREKEMAREVIIKSIQQYAGDVTGEMTQTMVKLENDDVKGKLIGKEGRNIIAFEKATGVSLIIDDTPDNVFISSFDLFRRYIAKKSLEELIEDKRIQPARIEEIVEKNQAEADTLIYDLGTKTLNEMGISGIPDEIIPLIGKFRFRTSYGQNILMHSKEVAYIAESIAKLIGADASLALKGGLLHDLGKAMDHDVEGTHPEIGGRIARKYGLDERIVNIIEGHHDDVPQICLETKIIQIADAISAIRPGARRMNAEEYIKRIQEMENLAMSFSGVNKAYALSAGREVRIFVDADTVSDIDAMKMAQEIAGTIETNLSYPGEIKVNLIREKRVIEYAR